MIVLSFLLISYSTFRDQAFSDVVIQTGNFKMAQQVKSATENKDIKFTLSFHNN